MHRYKVKDRALVVREVRLQQEFVGHKYSFQECKINYKRCQCLNFFPNMWADCDSYFCIKMVALEAGSFSICS